MKKIKKIVSLMLVAVMLLAMGSTAFAADKKTVTINNPAKGHTYTAYQILQGTKNTESGKLENLNWGAGISEDGKAALKTHLGLPAGATVAEVAVKLAAIEKAEAMDAVAQILGDNKAGNGTVLTVNEGKASATVDQGYYVIIDTLGADADADSTVSKYMVQVVGDVAINTKAEPTSSQKTVKDKEDAYKKFTEANIGEERTFYLLAKLPTDYAAYSAFYMEFNDTMNQMDFVKITKVEVKENLETKEEKYDPTSGTSIKEITAQQGEAAINGYEVSSSANTEANKTELKVKLLDLKQIAPEAKAGDFVVVEYVAKLNAGAVINGANVNEFELVFSKDPNSNWKPETPKDEPDTPTGTTPKDTAEVYTTEVELLKIDGTTKDILQGAEFTLTGETNDVVIKTYNEFAENADGEYWKLKNGSYTTTEPTSDTEALYESTETKYAPNTRTEILAGETNQKEIKAVVGKDGKITFAGLGEGKYKLEESKVPDGYNKMDPKEFEITFDRTSKQFAVSGGLDSLVATIENFSGSLLPSTGGIGTTIFYVVGAILVIGAGIILVAKKRMSNQQ